MPPKRSERAPSSKRPAPENDHNKEEDAADTAGAASGCKFTVYF